MLWLIRLLQSLLGAGPGDGSITKSGTDLHAELPPAENRIDQPEPSVAPPAVVPASAFSRIEPVLHDRRATASKKHDYGKRDWSKVTGICLHQTACVLGERPARWDTVGAHLGVTRQGKAIWIHDFDRLIVHGNGWNAQCVGIEIDGMYAGIEGDERTLWKPKDDPGRKSQLPTPEAIETTIRMIEWVKERIEQHGGKLKALVAHRQASKDRQADPGSAIWKAIALPMIEKHGFTDGGPGFKLGTGYPIPEAWDPKKKGYKY